MPLVECIPNFSEGRRKEVVDRIVAAIESAGVAVLDVEMDPAHHRSVVTFVGEPEAVLEAAFRGAAEAVQLIDLNQHRGEHPRIGAVDVIPFVPLEGATMELCVDLARRLGQRLAEELNLPVYLYEEAAARPDRKDLANIRKGEYEGLREAIRTDPDRAPDFGPRELGPAGAVAVGARHPLIAYNVNLNTPDLSIAKKIARAVRHRTGGFRYVKALGMETPDPNVVQVSMNMTRYTRTPLHRVLEAIRSEAARYGVTVRESEIVGLVPEDALLDAAEHYLQLNRFSRDQILERRLAGIQARRWRPDRFLERLADPASEVGAGAAAALTAATAAALAERLAPEEERSAWRARRERLAALAEADGAAYGRWQANPQDREAAADAIRIPLEVAEAALEILEAPPRHRPSPPEGASGGDGGASGGEGRPEGVDLEVVRQLAAAAARSALALAAANLEAVDDPGLRDRLRALQDRLQALQG